MSEMELRMALVNAAEGFVGVREGSTKHKTIVDTYNSHTPRARGYRLQYTDAWCAGFVGAMAVQAGLTAVIPMEVSVPKMVALAQEMGIWVENDAHVPESGDLIVFYWNDDGKGDAGSGANHVGIVKSVANGKITTVEGNYNNAVGCRTLAVNGRYIRGFICPDYAGLAGEDPVQYCLEHGLLTGEIDPDRDATMADLARVAAALHRALI